MTRGAWRQRLRTWPDRPHPWVIVAAALIVLCAATAGALKYIGDARAHPAPSPAAVLPVDNGPGPVSSATRHRTHHVTPAPVVTQAYSPPFVTTPAYVLPPASTRRPPSLPPSRPPSPSAPPPGPSPSPDPVPASTPSVTAPPSAPSSAPAPSGGGS